MDRFLQGVLTKLQIDFSQTYNLCVFHNDSVAGVMAFTVLCVLCYLLSRPGHFDVNGHRDECASFTRTLTV